MRALIAVDVPSARPSEPEDRPPPPDHLTLRFFADLPLDSVPEVVQALSEVARRSVPFSITVAGIGAFPSSRDPKVVWRGITSGRESLVALVADLDGRLARSGFPADARPFVPHLTWFRVRSDRDRALAREVLATAGPAPLTATVDRLALKASTLTPEGPIHRAIAIVGLGPPPGTD